MVRLLLIAGTFFLLPAPGLADDTAQANRLLVADVRLVEASELRMSP